MMHLQGVGLGLRKSFQSELKESKPTSIDFLELAPENWMGVGGVRAELLEHFTQQYPVVCHGLSLSIGGPAPLDIDFLKQLKVFMDNHQISLYSEHLCYCGDEGHLYDLMPLPFTQEAVEYVANRVKQVQDILERRIALENISYYAIPPNEMKETDFVNAVLSESQCDLLLDVNNVYVNSVNHGYDCKDFIKSLNPENIPYLHIAGHYVKGPNLIIDTHGSDVIDAVWDILKYTYELHGIIPTLLERDSDIPPLNNLIKEVGHIHHLQNEYMESITHGE